MSSRYKKIIFLHIKIAIVVLKFRAHGVQKLSEIISKCLQKYFQFVKVLVSDKFFNT